ncbi:hypothetical protein Aduo_011961 [Ancylostoma duodenale]
MKNDVMLTLFSRIGDCALQLLAEFNWNIISIIYTRNEGQFCDDIMKSLMTAISDPNVFSPTVAIKQVIDVGNNESYSRILQQVQARSRGKTVLSCSFILTYSSLSCAKHSPFLSLFSQPGQIGKE